jgi:putative ABC transport system substrate-binding protein
MKVARLTALAALALALLAAPLAVEAQPLGRPARLGVLVAVPAWAPESYPDHRGLVAGLREQGFVPGQNVVIEFRSLHGKGVDQIPIVAAELVGLGVDAVVTSTEPYVTALRNASRTIPIVMAGASIDPVAAGFVTSLARPGGTITGVTLGDLAAKRLELLKEAVPGLRSVAAFHGDLGIPFVAQSLRLIEAAARRLNLLLNPVPLLGTDPGPWEQIFESVARRGIGAATIHESPRYETHQRRLAELAMKHRLPMVVLTFRSQAEAGGLMAYSPDEEEIFRRAGSLAARILKGAKPADLPVEEPTKYQFVINLKTAKALGLTIPPAVLARADEVIQ